MSPVDMRVVRSPVEFTPHRRLLIIADGLQKVIDVFKSDVVAVERVFAQSNVRSVTGTVQVAGIIMLAMARVGLHLAMYTPLEIKAAVTGNGRADKRQVQAMVQRILGFASFPWSADAADVVAIATVHSWRGGALSDEEPDRVQHGGAGTLPQATGGDLTPAQRTWAGAERMLQRYGAVVSVAKNGVQS